MKVMNKQPTEFFQTSILLGLVIFCTSACTINDNSNIVSNNPIFREAKTCENDEVKNLVIEIFKEHNQYYKDIDKSSINNITLMYPAASSYDKDIDKYSCTGTIIMTSANGFLPISYDYENNYYSMIGHSFDKTPTIKTYDILKTYMEYDSQISEGQILVQAGIRNNDFSCSNTCPVITDMSYIEQEKRYMRKELAKQAEKQRDEHAILPNF